MKHSNSKKVIQLTVYWMRRCFIYIIEKRYPDEATENRKQIIRRKAKKFEIQDGGYITEIIARVQEER